MMLKYFRSLGIFGVTRLGINFLLTKLLFWHAHLLRWPFYIRVQGKVAIGKGFTANAGLVLDAFGSGSVVTIGRNVQANYRLHIGCCSRVSIGDNTLFGSDCLVIDHSHGSYGPLKHSSPFQAPQKRELVSSPISIGANCWFGDRVTILPGVTIGDGVVVGAGSVVNAYLPSHVIAVGAPARIIKRFSIESGKWEKVVNNAS